MQQMTNERFWGRASGVIYNDLALTDCEFNGCVIARDSGSPQNRIERVSLQGAAQLNCSISEAVLRDVQLDNLKRLGNAPLFLWGCLFERVTLSGRISAVQINQRVGLPSDPPERQRAHNALVTSFYSNSDWALDISAAEFPGGVTLDAIPGDKVRRDPERQFLIKRAALSGMDWRSVDFDGTALDINLSGFERDSLFDSVVLSQRSDRKWAKRDQAVLRRLCDAGIASS
jgi:uncharacterized protein YjbI with pentapeptide repeats